MIGRRHYGSLFAGAVGLCALFAACTAQAQVTVSPTVGFSGGLFHYDYSVTSTSSNDVFLIDVTTPQDPLAVQNLMAPTGFMSAFDPGLGLVSFLEDTSMFGPTPVSGFTFDSPYGPNAASFTASFVDSMGGIGTLVGPTVGPVPEPGSMIALAALAVSGTLLLRRRKSGPRKRTVL